MRYLISLLILIVCFSCQKDKNDYDCYSKSILYSNDNKLLKTNITYYKENRIIKEISDNDTYDYVYDKNGNVLSVRNNNNLQVNTYNSDNQIIRRDYYVNNVLSYYFVYFYDNNKLSQSVQVITYNDKSDTTRYYYFNNDRVKEIFGDDSIINYYANHLLDSSFFYQNGILRVLHTYEYNNNNIILVIAIGYYETGIVEDTIRTKNKYNERNQIIECDISGYHLDDLIYAHKYIYNSENKLIRVNYVDIHNNDVEYCVFENSCY